MTLVLLEVNLCRVITVLFQEIQIVKFGFRTSGDSIVLEFVLLDAQTNYLVYLVLVFYKSLSSFNDVLLNF